MNIVVRRFPALACAALLVGVVSARSTGAVRALDLATVAPMAIPQAAKFEGAANCTSSDCHRGPKDWSLNSDGDGTKKRQHRNAINQLEDKNAVKYVKAVSGGSDPYVEKSCLDCHTTGARGNEEGITCEKCHGAGSRYKEPHAAKPIQPASAFVGLGMKDYGGDPKRWVPLCVNCHVLNSSPAHQKLAEAGHPTGDGFKVAEKFTVVQGPPNSHWVNKRPAAGLVAAAAPRPMARPAAAPPTTPPGPAPAPAPAPPVVVPPAPAPVSTPALAPPPDSGRLVSPVLPPVKPVVATPPRVVVTPPPTAPVPVPPVDRGAGAATRRTPPPAPTPAPPPTPAVAPSPLPSALPSGQTSDPPPSPETVPVEASPRSISGLVASVQGRLINFLTSLIRQNVVVPQRVVPPAKGLRYSGPDAELLKLQEEVIGLALEILGSAPPKGGGSS